MRVVQHRNVPIPSEQPYTQWNTRATSPKPTMSDRIYQPLEFSIDGRLAQQHLTRLDLCSKNLKKIDKLPTQIQFNVVLLDCNEITKLEHLDVLTHLVELSISHNRLIDIRLLTRLRTLQKLNLSNNSIDSIDCLKTLSNLVILNIASNNVQSLAPLSTCHALQSLDASDNCVRQLEDMSQLKSLKYLNLRRNLIDRLASVPKCCPKSIHTLILADNEIKDLTEVSFLSSLKELNTLEIQDNPCLFVVDERRGCHQAFDHRPYVLNWCLLIQNLDGLSITRKESLKAEWLLSQGKGRSFRPGDHWDLVQYLIKVCGTNTDERDDLHLSRIMVQQDLFTQNRSTDEKETASNEQAMNTLNTMKDASEGSLKDTQSKVQRSLLISESEFVQISPSSSVSTIDEPSQTPRSIRRTSNQQDDPITDPLSHNRYVDYDNRPIKPLDQHMLQSRLNQYPVDHPVDDQNASRPRSSTNPPPNKQSISHAAYNANRYSPKTTNHGPTASAAMHVKMRPKTNKTPTTQENKTAKRHTIAAEHLNDNHRTSKVETQQKKQTSSNDSKNRTDDDEERQLKSAPAHDRASSPNSTLHRLKTISRHEGTKRTMASADTTRKSIFQAYLDLHEHFTKTTELQTSALAALWKKFESSNSKHQRETEKIMEENRSLKQRLHDLEARLNHVQLSSIPTTILHPPLRAHISKRDTKSFFLRWSANPLNDQRAMLGYRIYIDDALKSSVSADQLEAVIDCIRDEGEYRIKLRAYDGKSESHDSNVVIARFRRQQSGVSHSESLVSETTALSQAQSDRTVDQRTDATAQLRHTQSEDHISQVPIIMGKQRERNDTHQMMSSNEYPFPTQQQQQRGAFPITPDRKTTSSEEILPNSPPTSSHQNDMEMNFIRRKPPRSPTSSPSHQSDKSSPSSGSCNKALFINDAASASTAKQSPTKTGIMSRLIKHTHKVKRNNVLLNALPINLTRSPTEQSDTNQGECPSFDRRRSYQAQATPEPSTNVRHSFSSSSSPSFYPRISDSNPALRHSNDTGSC